MTTISLLANRHLVLGVTGSIAGYKAVDLASKLTQAGALVDVILTEAAERFVTPLTFQSVTGRPVYTKATLWGRTGHVPHVGLGESADLMLIAPATAHTLAKLAHGLADNLLTVTALAARGPVMLAPAMDGGMYNHPAVQANLALLRARGVWVIEPAVGRMASGLQGMGRLPETPELIGRLRLALGQGGLLAGRRVMITAGPTQEPLDPVRYLSNHSSGKQGLALAQAALDMGAQVTLVAGPISLPTPVGAVLAPVKTAMQMHEAVMARLPETDILVMAAAVGDFRPKNPSPHKIKKNRMSDDAPSLELIRNLDILMAVQAWRQAIQPPLLVVGFAAETQDVLAYGREKMQHKGLDYIAINDVGSADAGFAVDTNRVTLLGPQGLVVEMPLADKTLIAEQIMQQVAQHPRLPPRPGG